MRVLLSILALGLILPAAAKADELSDLKAQLDAAMKSIQTLQKRVEALEAEKAKAAAAAAPAAATATTAETKAGAAVTAAGGPVIAPNEKPIEGEPDQNKARLEIYGFVQADFAYGFKLMNPDWYSAFRPSQIPINCPGDAGCGKDGYTNFSVKQTRFGVNGFLPTKEGEVRGQFEFDLFGVGPDAGQTTIRVRQAWAEWGQFLVGQTNSLFMDGDVFPNIIEYWGPSGMIFFRNIQARWTPYDKEGNKFAIALENPGTVVDGTSAGFAGVPGGVTAYNKLPDFTAQYRMDRDWGHFQASGILRQLGFQSPGAPGGDPSGTATGYGLNLAGSYNTIGKDKINAQLAYGKGIAAYSNDCCVDLATDAAGNAEAVPLLDWLLYYDHWWTDKLSSSIGYSRNFQSNTSGQATTAQRTGQYASVNLLWYPVRNVMTGVELVWGERENKDGASANDTRLQFSGQWKF